MAALNQVCIVIAICMTSAIGYGHEITIRHGLYSTESADTRCSFVFRRKTANELLRFSLTARPGEPITAQLISDNPDLKTASVVQVSLDGIEVLHFTSKFLITVGPSIKQNTLYGLNGQLDEDGIGLALLRSLSRGERMQLAALPFYKSFSTAGLAEAVADFQRCISGKVPR